MLPPSVCIGEVPRPSGGVSMPQHLPYMDMGEPPCAACRVPGTKPCTVCTISGMMFLSTISYYPPPPPPPPMHSSSYTLQVIIQLTAVVEFVASHSFRLD